MGDSKGLNVAIHKAENAEAQTSFPDFLNSQDLLSFLKLSVELAADEVFWLRANAQIFYVNEAACLKLGYTKQELTGKFVWELDPLFPESVWIDFWRELKAEKHKQLESKHKSKSGTVFPISIKAHFFTHKNEEFAFAYVTDISKTKSQEATLEAVNSKITAEVALKTAELVKEKELTAKYAKQLEESVHRYDLAIEGTGVGLWSWDVPTNDNYWTAKFYELLGYENEEIEASFDEWEARLHPEDKDRVFDALNAHLCNKSKYETEFRLLCKDGEFRWFLVKGKAEFNDENQPVYMVGSLEDIHTQKQLEAAYKFEQEKFEQFVNLAPVGIAINHMDTGEFQYVNHVFSDFTGYDIDELNAMDYWQLTPKKYEAQEQLQLQMLSERGHYGPYEKEYIHKKGHCYPVLLSGVKMIGLDGKESIWSVVQDITLRKKAEVELKNSVLSRDEAVKAGNIGIWDWDIITNDVTFSKEYKQQLGYTEQEFQNDFNEWASRIHPDDLQPTLDAVNKSIAERNINHEREFRLMHKDGNYRWILSHGSVITNESGQPIRMIGSHVDVTERKLLEEELRQSQKMEAIGHLAGGIAHDFNNQLASIMGFAELLASKLDEPKLQKYVNQIISAAENSGNLTNQLLTFSRKQNLNLEVVDLHELLTEFVSLLKRSIDKRILIATEFTSQYSHINGDKSLILNALLNLGLNARDAMPEGGSIILATEFVADCHVTDAEQNIVSGSAVKFTFTDSGHGINSDVLPRVFEPFFTTKEVGKGTGMGLASVYGAIKQLGGHIEVSSQPNEGTCFTVHFPIVNAQGESDTISVADTDTANKNNKTILVVDDEEAVRQLFKDSLAALGYETILAPDGVEALEIFKSQKNNIDLVILDMIMPIMSGKEVYLALRNIDPNVKVMIASGYTAGNSLTEMVELGVATTISKPFRLTTLQDRIATLFDNSRA
ncbi:MAG: PAS domain S-box protein [Alteromonadaceae bacterium]|nr:PAS domain S-box protein [Alteromonadaceae bacterium]